MGLGGRSTVGRGLLAERAVEAEPPRGARRRHGAHCAAAKAVGARGADESTGAGARLAKHQEGPQSLRYAI